MSFPILALLPLAESIINKFIPDPEAKAKALLELRKEENQQTLKELEIQAQTALSQVEVNKIEAANENLFVSGWRPAIGWCCAIAFFYNYVGQPFAAFIISNYTGHPALLPSVDMEVIGWTLAGMLGLGGTMRTFEKVKGVSK